MVNVTIINLKTIIKYLIGIVILIIIIFCTKSMYNKKTKNIQTQITNINLTSCLDTTLPDIEIKKDITSIKKTSYRGSITKRILSNELPIMNNLIIDGEEDEYIRQNITQDTEQNTNNNNNEIAKTDVKTEEIQDNNITPKYNSVYGSVKIKNESDKEINEEILTPNISLENNKDILIFHTHTCESYTPSEKFSYEMTGTYRTTDLKYTVAKVGEELKSNLTNYGYNVTHDQTYHDYPAYTGSYGRSLTTVENILKNGCNAQMIIDLHRDAIRK